MESTRSLSFKVARKNPELIAPAKPTPHEFKVLSDVDLQEVIRFHIPVIYMYRENPSAKGKDPAMVIRDAIAKVLVFYYPFAGRLRECSGGKLAVECTGEGVLFIEADADVTLQQLEDAGAYPPFPYKEELLYDVPASAGILHCPLLLIQVTRLKCGGFVFGIRLNHTMSDADGLAQFMSAIGEVARGAETPSIPPTWDRHLLCAAAQIDDINIISATPDAGAISTPAPPEENDVALVHRAFHFGAAEFSALRSRLPPHLRDCSTFDLLTACIWRCRTIAIITEPEEEAKLLFTFNFRKRISPPLPDGYYGNGILCGVASASAGELSRNPLQYALELVRDSKTEVIEKLKQPSPALHELVLRVRQHFTLAGGCVYIVSDARRNRFEEEVDFGWGKSACGGPAESSFFGGFYIPFKKNKQADAAEIGVMVPMCMPAKAMDVFSRELHMMFKPETNLFIKSPL